MDAVCGISPEKRLSVGAIVAYETTRSVLREAEGSHARTLLLRCVGQQNRNTTRFLFEVVGAVGEHSWTPGQLFLDEQSRQGLRLSICSQIGTQRSDS